MTLKKVLDAKPKFVKVGGKVVPVDPKKKAPDDSESVVEDAPKKPDLRPALKAIQKLRQKRLDEVQREREKASEGSIK